MTFQVPTPAAADVGLRDEPGATAGEPRSPLALVRSGLHVALTPWRGSVIPRGLARAALDMAMGFVIGTGLFFMLGVSTVAAITFVAAIPLLRLMFGLAALLGKVERSRAAALLDVDVATPHQPLEPGTWGNRMRQMVTSLSRWREIGYLVLGLPFLGGLGFVVLGLWVTSALFFLAPFYLDHTLSHAVGIGPIVVPGQGWAVPGMLLGLVGLVFVAPWATLGLVCFDGEVVCWLLGPHRQEELVRRVGALEVSRDAAVGQSEAERRRIAQDLHDGAQQRLVALAMDLGRARERFDTDPAGARALVEQAHEESKAALAELRDLARGIHPAVLTDRGLDAALSSVVARCPVPVSLLVDVAERPPAPVESAAYFVVAEALTNVAKHARARRAQVTVTGRGSTLSVEVWDDGCGGAKISGGNGLAGLFDRATALGGTLRVESPVGGPTRLVVELPCVS